jgi:hypothetical protein
MQLFSAPLLLKDQFGDLDPSTTTELTPPSKRNMEMPLLPPLTPETHKHPPSFNLSLIHPTPPTLMMISFNKKISSQEIMDTLDTKEKSQFNSKQMLTISS